jgi:hypothetical protein
MIAHADSAYICNFPSGFFGAPFLFLVATGPSANAAERHLLDSGWRRSCAASGPQLHGSLRRTGQRHTPPHYSLDLVHGPGVGPGLWPRLLPPTCLRRVCSVGMGLFC